MSNNRGLLIVALYALGIVFSFGPATVQSERARERHLSACRVENASDPERARWCPVLAPSSSDGLPKAVFWPLWLSYTLALNLPAGAEHKGGG